MLNLSFPRIFVRTQDFADIFDTFATVSGISKPGFGVSGCSVRKMGKRLIFSRKRKPGFLQGFQKKLGG